MGSYLFIVIEYFQVPPALFADILHPFNFILSPAGDTF
jgi:hypothetical protein